MEGSVLEWETAGHSSSDGRMIIDLKFHITEVPSHHNFVEFIIAEMEGGVILPVHRDRWICPPDHGWVTFTIENENNLKCTRNRTVEKYFISIFFHLRFRVSCPATKNVIHKSILPRRFKHLSKTLWIHKNSKNDLSYLQPPSSGINLRPFQTCTVVEFRGCSRHKALSSGCKNKYTTICIKMYILSTMWVRHGTTYETKLHSCRVARQSFFPTR